MDHSVVQSNWLNTNEPLVSVRCRLTRDVGGESTHVCPGKCSCVLSSHSRLVDLQGKINASGICSVTMPVLQWQYYSQTCA